MPHTNHTAIEQLDDICSVIRRESPYSRLVSLIDLQPPTKGSHVLLNLRRLGSEPSLPGSASAMTDVHFEEVAFVDIPNAELSPLDISTTSSQSLSSV